MIKIGIIGCGGISKGHVFRLHQIRGVKIAGFCDIDVEKARRLRDFAFPENDFRKDELIYKDYKEMIKEEELDAVYILTPHSLHYPQIVYALQNDLNVLVEKPMVCKYDNAIKVMEEVKKKVLLVSYQRHFIPTYIFLRESIRNKEIGELRMITVMLNQDWTRLSKGTWRMNPKLSCGGMLMDSGSHVVDLVLWATGIKPVRVYARVSNDSYPVDVYSNILLELENGVTVNFAINGNAPKFEEKEVFYGSNGYIKVSDRPMIVKEDGETIIPSRLPRGSNPDENFINVILGKEENKSPGDYGVAVAKLTEAIYRSSRENKTVEIA